MEQRERTQEHVIGAGIQNAFALFDITHQVVMREFHTLRPTFGARTKDYRSHIVKRDLLEETQFQVPGRQYEYSQEVENHGSLRNHLLKVFHIVHFVLRKQNVHVNALLLQFLDKDLGRNNALDFGYTTAIVHGFRRIGVVQVVDRLAAHKACHVGNNARARRRNQHTHLLFADS